MRGLSTYFGFFTQSSYKTNLNQYFLVVRAALARSLPNKLAHQGENFSVAFGTIVLHDLEVFLNEMIVKVTFMLCPSLNLASMDAIVGTFVIWIWKTRISYVALAGILTVRIWTFVIFKGQGLARIA